MNCDIKNKYVLKNSEIENIKKIYSIIIPLKSKKDCVKKDEWNIRVSLLKRSIASLLSIDNDNIYIYLSSDENPFLEYNNKKNFIFIYSDHLHSLNELKLNLSKKNHINFDSNLIEYNLSSRNKFQKIEMILKVIYETSPKSVENFLIILDSDDFLSKDLFSYINKNHSDAGYYMTKGFVMNYETGNICESEYFNKKKFYQFCGSGNIIKVIKENFLNVNNFLNFLKNINFYSGHNKFFDSAEIYGVKLVEIPFRACIYTQNCITNLMNLKRSTGDAVLARYKKIDVNKINISPEFKNNFKIF